MDATWMIIVLGINPNVYEACKEQRFDAVQREVAAHEASRAGGPTEPRGAAPEGGKRWLVGSGSARR